MYTLHVNEDERTILLEMLETCISDLKSEIFSTDNVDYKMMLKGRKAILIKLYETFQLPEVETALHRAN